MKNLKGIFKKKRITFKIPFLSFRNVDFLVFPIYTTFQLGIMGMNPKASFGNRFRSKLRRIKPSASRDCSTYQFRYATLSELEFHNKKWLNSNLTCGKSIEDRLGSHVLI
jgi:hypothetical protein